MTCYLAQQLSDELFKFSQALCKAADEALTALNKKGIPTPGEWNKWSCDQKNAFLIAFGPELGLIVGPLMLVAGAFAAAIESKQAKELAAALSTAGDKVGGDVGKALTSLGQSASKAASQAESDVSHAGGQVSSTLKKYNPF
jgi:hypothetical protein